MQPDDYFGLIDGADSLENLVLSVPDDWEQGRTVFGGLSAGLLCRAMSRLTAVDRPLRSITFNFVAPLAANTPFHFAWQILRAGKNATQITANIVQDGQVCVAALGCFAVDRPSTVAVHWPTRTLPPQPDPSSFPRPVPALAPKFIGQIDLEVVEGDAPFSGSARSDISGWMRFRQQPEHISDAHLIVLIDAWPPAVLQMLAQPAPASTMSWNLELVHPHRILPSDGWLAYQVATAQAHGGYAHTEATIYSDSGELLAISRQLVSVFG